MTDHLIRCITHDGSIMAAAVDSTFIAAAAQQIHHTCSHSSSGKAAFGRCFDGFPAEKGRGFRDAQG